MISTRASCVDGRDQCTWQVPACIVTNLDNRWSRAYSSNKQTDGLTVRYTAFNQVLSNGENVLAQELHSKFSVDSRYFNFLFTVFACHHRFQANYWREKPICFY